jgi:endoglucanase
MHRLDAGATGSSSGMRTSWNSRLAAVVAAALLVLFVQCGAIRSAAAASRADERCALRHGINLQFEFRSTTVTDIRSRWPYLRAPDEAAARLKNVAAAGFDFVRVLLDPLPLMLQPNDESLGAPVTDFVRRARADGLCVVISPALPEWNPAWRSTTIFADPAKSDEFTRMLVRLGGWLSRERTGAALEFLNEPPGGCGSDRGIDWHRVQPSLYRAVRQVAPDLPILLTGDCWSSLDALTRLDAQPFAGDSNAFFTFHFYEPHEFAEQGTHKRCPYPQLSHVPYPATASCKEDALAPTRAAIARDGVADREQCERAAVAAVAAYCGRLGNSAYIGERMRLVRQWVDSNGVDVRQIIVGEFGVETRAEWPDRLRWIADTRNAISEQKFGWAVWALSGAFAIACPGGPPGNVCPSVRQALGLAT